MQIQIVKDVRTKTFVFIAIETFLTNNLGSFVTPKSKNVVCF